MKNLLTFVQKLMISLMEPCSFLLPNKFKTVGLVMLIPFSLICLWTLVSGELEFNYMNWPCISLFNSGLASDKVTLFEIGTTDPINEIGMLGLLVSLCFIALSREKDEDEMTGLIRMKSFVWSFWMTAIIFALGVVFLYDTSFLCFSFAAIFLVFLLFIVKFNVEMCKVRRESK